MIHSPTARPPGSMTPQRQGEPFRSPVRGQDQFPHMPPMHHEGQFGPPRSQPQGPPGHWPGQERDMYARPPGPHMGPGPRPPGMQPRFDRQPSLPQGSSDDPFAFPSTSEQGPPVSEPFTQPSTMPGGIPHPRGPRPPMVRSMSMPGEPDMNQFRPRFPPPGMRMPAPGEPFMRFPRDPNAHLGMRQMEPSAVSVFSMLSIFLTHFRCCCFTALSLLFS